MKEAIKDYVDRICYGRDFKTRAEIIEKAWVASIESNNEAELLRRILDISREFNNT